MEGVFERHAGRACMGGGVYSGHASLGCLFPSVVACTPHAATLSSLSWILDQPHNLLIPMTNPLPHD